MVDRVVCEFAESTKGLMWILTLGHLPELYNRRSAVYANCEQVARFTTSSLQIRFGRVCIPTLPLHTRSFTLHFRCKLRSPRDVRKKHRFHLNPQVILVESWPDSWSRNLNFAEANVQKYIWAIRMLRSWQWSPPSMPACKKSFSVCLLSQELLGP